MTDFSWPFQQGLYSALTGSTGVQAHVGTRVYDHVPQGTAAVKPYVTLGEDTELDWSTKSFDGRENTHTLHVWSDAHRGRKVCKQAMDAIASALHNNPFSVNGSNHLLCQFEFADTFLDPDGVTYHGVMRFRSLLQGTG